MQAKPLHNRVLSGPALHIGEVPTLWGNSIFFLSTLFALTFFHAVLSGILPAAEDELYYWVWAQTPQLSYFDHPPMVAYWIRLSTALFGDTVFGIRFFTWISATASVLILASLSPSRNLLTLVLLTPLFFFGAVLATPDAPLVLFWVSYLAWTWQTNEAMEGWRSDPISRVYQPRPVHLLQWCLGGMLLGLGLLGKYTMALAIPCSFIVFVTRTRPKAWVMGYSLHLLIALAFFSPVLLHNWSLDFAPLLFQWNHVTGVHAASVGRLFAFIRDQLLLVGGLPYLMLAVVVMQWRLFWFHPLHQTCWVFFVFPMTFFIWKAYTGPVEANWAIVGYLALWPLAERFLQYTSFKGLSRSLIGLAFLPPLVASLAVMVHSVSPLPWVPPKKERMRSLEAKAKLADSVREATQRFREMPPTFAPSYQWTSILLFHGVRAYQLGGRVSELSRHSKDPCTLPSVLVMETASSGALTCFKRRETITEFPIDPNGGWVEPVVLARYSR